MPGLFTELPLSAQTAYAQLLDATLALEHMRSVADLPGSFAAKTVRGHRYWYFQYTEPSGKLQQVYVGPDSPAVQRLMARKDDPAAGVRLGPLAQSALVLGCTSILPRHFRVLRRLADYGFFQAGGVLVGTHAFLAYSNMLGVRWTASDRTQDVDFADAGKSIALALPSTLEVQTDKAIRSLEMGFLPLTSFAAANAAGYLNPREPEFRLDFLTTRHRGSDEPFAHQQLGVTLQPLKFMEFSLEHLQQAVLFAHDSAVLVNVPHPARFALHKLLVFGEREGTFAAKSVKDLAQAAHLLARLLPDRGSEVRAAWEDLIGRGKAWVARAKQGLHALNASFPDLDTANWLRLQR